MASGTTELIVALDYSTTAEADQLVRTLAGVPVLFKVGSELFLTGGPDFVRKLIGGDHRVFLDLKFHDIPNTVAKAAAQAALMGVDMFTLHASGGRAMIAAVVQEFAKLPREAKRPKILGVSVLTSFSPAEWTETCLAINPFASKVSEIEGSVLSLAGAGAKWGLDGLVCSAHELRRAREVAPSLYTVIPGIRPAGSTAQDQARVMTPLEAQAAGANAIVVGRPITQAKDPKAATLEILKELGSTSP